MIAVFLVYLFALAFGIVAIVSYWNDLDSFRRLALILFILATSVLPLIILLFASTRNRNENHQE